MAVERGERDLVKVDDADAAGAGAGERGDAVGADAADADDDDDGAHQLLRDMAAVGLDARIVKVASAGLDEGFLWENVASEAGLARVRRAMSRFGGMGGDASRGSVLGEGGEFERRQRRRVVVARGEQDAGDGDDDSDGDGELADGWFLTTLILTMMKYADVRM